MCWVVFEGFCFFFRYKGICCTYLAKCVCNNFRFSGETVELFAISSMKSCTKSLVRLDNGILFCFPDMTSLCMHRLACFFVS